MRNPFLSQVLLVFMPLCRRVTRDCENRLGIILLERGRHGQRSARLIDEGNMLVNQFRKVLDEMDRFASGDSMLDLIETIKNPLKG